MKKQLLFLSVLLTIGTVLSIGCMDRKPAPVCPVPTELKASDPGLGGFEGVDILVVVDNSGSMAQEQEILATAFFPLINSLINPTPGWEFDPADDVRIAITTSDMGVSYSGNPYTDTFSPHPVCSEGDGMGDNGRFRDRYISTTVNIKEGIIPCGADAEQCPTDWTCGNIDPETNVGTCENPNGDGLAQDCPQSPNDVNQTFVDETWPTATAAFTTACLANVGTEGCAFEQQLAAAAAGLRYDPTFIRERSLTTVMIVSDEEDCSLASDEWHTVEELATNERNIACGVHKDLLTSVLDLKNSYDAAKEAKAGHANGMLFAAIIGVPIVPECQGAGSGLASCMAYPLDHGTVGDPGVIERPDPNGNPAMYYEWACERFDGDVAVTQAYPGVRYLEMAQAYEDMSYIYSICQEDWSEAMVDIAELIAKNLGGTCYAKRLNWDPQEETAGCNVVYDYKFDKAEHPSAPRCADIGEDAVWVDDEGDLTEAEVKIGSDTVRYWVRSCAVQKIPAPLNCAEFENASEVETTQFGWYYCENPGENNSVACADGLDNDRDGLIDGQDDSCDACLGKADGVCPKDCPYKVSISDPALAEAANAADTNVVCLQQYRFEDPNCKESTYDSCNDGEDNDGNGPFDCYSYGKDETIPSEHFPSAGARKADPDCCPMRRNPDGGACQFLDAYGHPVATEEAAWVANCNSPGDTNSSAAAMPDSCCEAATALLCQLPSAFNDECVARGM
ncbi:MAG: hypothetical protein JXX29_19000 [Deltaproteobacteria bacterium]|nr:hypothetical protein [Deltaproteobacteria bacterium]MBN2673775.1 hypothetical protein [Deltaproteobacteria bacterium]